MLAPVATGLGFDLVRVVVSKVGGQLTLQILAERPEGGMTIEDCAKLSRPVAYPLYV
jgi:ribosome maturation factor RimP